MFSLTASAQQVRNDGAGTEQDRAASTMRKAEVVWPSSEVCNNVMTLPFVETFEYDSPSFDKWYGVDNDGDGINWHIFEDPEDAHGGSNTATSASYLYEPLTPDNWIVSPFIEYKEGRYLEFYVNAQDKLFPNEHYAVYVIGGDVDVQEFIANPTTPIFEETFSIGETAPEMNATGPRKIHSAWQLKHIVIDGYTGEPVRIAFRHFNCTNNFRINIDDVTVDYGETVGIQEIDNGASETDNRMYDTIGRQIYKPAKGQLYIKGGKKYIAR